VSLEIHFQPLIIEPNMQTFGIWLGKHAPPQSRLFSAFDLNQPNRKDASLSLAFAFDRDAAAMQGHQSVHESKTDA
jgi:hypothetical protein